MARALPFGEYGRIILEQPGHTAWQIFDSKVLHLLIFHGVGAGLTSGAVMGRVAGENAAHYAARRQSQ